MLLVVALPVVAADFLTIDTVRINGDETGDGDILFVERGDELDIRVTLEAGDEEVRNAQVQALIAGYQYANYERDLVTDFSRTFDLPANNRRSFNLNVQVPVDIDKKDAKLRLIVADENSPQLITYNYQLNIEGTNVENAVRIRNFELSPRSDFMPGQSMSANVRVRNDGQRILDDVSVRVSIPELGISDFETIDRLDTDETRTFESLFLRIPQNAAAGTYTVRAEVEFDRFESRTETRTITVSEAEVDEPEDVSTFTIPGSIELREDGPAQLLPILIENQGPTSTNYVLSVSDVSDWGSASFEPSSVVAVAGGQSQTAYVRLQADEAGDQVFTVRVEHNGETVERTVRANVQEAQEETQESDVDLRNILEWSLLILVVLLIILGLVLLFTRMRKGGNDEDDETQTYY